MSYTYEQLNSELNGKDRKVLKRNLLTWIERKEDHIGIFLVESEIMRFYQDGTIVLDSCGWQTATTKQRMNDYLPRPWGIGQEKGLWYLVWHEITEYPPVGDELWGKTEYKSTRYGFRDGITIQPDGSVDNYSEHADEKELKKKLDKYVKGYVEALAKGEVSAPGPGDCFGCQMRVVDEGKISNGQQVIEYGQGKLVNGQIVSEPVAASKVGLTLGEATDNDHLLSHLEEKYYVPSLLKRAIELYGSGDTMSPMTLQWVWEIWYGDQERLQTGWTDLFQDQTRKCLKKYLKRQLGLPS